MNGEEDSIREKRTDERNFFRKGRTGEGKKEEVHYTVSFNEGVRFF